MSKLETRLPLIFYHFVGNKDSRYQLSEPFESNGYCYATNGRACVRMPAVGFSIPRPAYPGLIPNCEDLEWDPKLYLPEPFSFDVPEQQFDICGKCAGGGQVMCEYEHEHDCPRCGGSGQIPEHKYVLLCDGIKLRFEDAAALRKFRCQVYLRSDRQDKRPLRFWDNLMIEGLIMPAPDER